VCLLIIFESITQITFVESINYDTSYSFVRPVTYIDCTNIFLKRTLSQPITVVVRSKAGTAFALSNTEIVGSNPTRSIDVCVSLFCVFVVLRVGSGLVTG
jgi:hypothetical protein